jgi:hypothetical protein
MLNELNQFYKDKYPIFYTYVEFRGCRTWKQKEDY